MASTRPPTRRPFFNPRPVYNRRAPAYGSNPRLSNLFTQSESEEREELPVLYLNLCTPITITGDTNLCSIEPSLCASQISTAVVGALTQMTTGANGVPMADQDGVPRPIRVDVLAEMKIEGSGNVIGEKAVVSIVSSEMRMKKRKASGASVSSDGNKRERANSEPVGGEAKKVRTE